VLGASSNHRFPIFLVANQRHFPIGVMPGERLIRDALLG
jgi:hypothetical protein